MRSSACPARSHSAIRRPASTFWKRSPTNQCRFGAKISCSKWRTRSVAQGSTKRAGNMSISAARHVALSADKRHELEEPNLGLRRDGDWLIEVERLPAIDNNDDAPSLEGLQGRRVLPRRVHQAPIRLFAVQPTFLLGWRNEWGDLVATGIELRDLFIDPALEQLAKRDALAGKPKLPNAWRMYTQRLI